VDDRDVLGTINRLAEREEELRAAESGRRLTPEERVELSELEVHLDQCWDLLRQRRARREFGQDPDAAEPRPPDTVERYRQ
jgi:Protein of unknown function (DUF2630)